MTDLVKTQMFTSNNANEARSRVSLKIFDLPPLWRSDRIGATIYVNPGYALSVSDEGAFADFILAWKDCQICDNSGTAHLMYNDELWRLMFEDRFVARSYLLSKGGLWHEIYAGNDLIWAYLKEGPKYDIYRVNGYAVTVLFNSQDSWMNAGAAFVREYYWS